mgnify:FL=1
MVLGLFGAGGAGKSLYDSLIRDKKTSSAYDQIVFVDDVIGVSETHGVRVYTYAEITQMYTPEELKFLISLGTPEAREKLFLKIKGDGYSLAKWIHPHADVSPTASFGEGTIVFDTYIDADVTIGDNTLVYKNAVIGHDTQVKEHCVISVNAFIGGHSMIGKRAYFGPCAAARDQIHIGDGALVGVNAAVFKDVPDDYAAIGNPAKNLPKSKGDMFQK